MTRWAAVLAGGSGTRFWPLSTPEIPKQMLALAGDASLLEQAVRRLEGLIPPQRIIVVTAERLRSETAKRLAHIPNENILGEPQPASMRRRRGERDGWTRPVGGAFSISQPN